VNLEIVARFILPSVRPGDFFASSERRTLTAAAEAMLRGSPVSIAPEEVAGNVERFLLRGRSQRAWRIRLLLTLIEFTPLLLLRRRFSRLSCDQRVRLIEERYVHGRYLWALCAKVKHLVYLGAYGGPAGERAVGFVPVSMRPRHYLKKEKAALP
jgi:hypothetical protein